MHILVFGDSITYGAWDTKGGWVHRLREVLDKKTLKDINKYTLIYNLGVSGDTSRDILKRFEKEASCRIDENEETMFIFALGANDCAFVHSEKEFLVSEEEFVRNFDQIVFLSKIYTEKIIFLGLTPVDEEKTDPLPWADHLSNMQEHRKKFNDMLERMCRDKGVHFIEIFDKLNKKDLEDGDHPNSKGHEKIYLSVKKYLEENKLI